MERRVGKLEVDVGTILTTLRMHSEWVGESRQFHTEMNTFKTQLLATQDAIRDEQRRRHQTNSIKLNIITILIAFGTLLIGIASFITVNFFRTHSQADPAKILFKSEQTAPELSLNASRTVIAQE